MRYHLVLSCVILFFPALQRIDKLITMCGSVDGVYLALIGDGAMGPALSERHGCWSNSGKRRTKVIVKKKRGD